MTERIGASDILDVLRVRLETLSPAERAIAELVLSDPAGAQDRTIGQLAQLARSSEATVTRFCRSIGLPGYSQFRLALAVAAERRRNGGHGDAGLAMLGELRAGRPSLYARVSEVRRTEDDELVFSFDSIAVRAAVDVTARRLAEVEPVEADLARRDVRPAELDLRFRDQVIARVQ